MRTILISGAIVAGLAAPALAGNIDPAPADPVLVAPLPIAAPVGTDWTGPYVGAQVGYGFGEASSTDLDGVIGGIYGGYNYDFGQFVLGGEADISLGELEIDGAVGDIDTVARLKARAGFDAGRALFYGTAGAAYADAELGGVSASDFGWVVGAGVDVKVTERITAGVEYLYHDFNDFDGTGSDVSVNTVSARVGLSF